MTKSMTAYSQATTQTELGELSCELRTVNHRYLDIAPRMPEELRVQEPLLRDCLLYTSPSPRDRQKSRMPSSA